MELFKEVDKRAMKLMKEIENKMDEMNGALGDAGSLCLFCHAKMYDGQEGVKHHPECPIAQVRVWIKDNGGSLLD